MDQNTIDTLSIDVGGTFTDLVWRDSTGLLQRHKVPSDNQRFERVRDAVTAHDEPQSLGEARVMYSTTTTLNSLLVGETAKIGLIVTKGFREILETARFPASAGKAPGGQLAERVVGLEYVREINARLGPHGEERRPLDNREVKELARDFNRLGCSVIAISLLHSYQNPDHEQQLATLLKEFLPNITLILSSDVLPEQREYERTLTTAVNASLLPTLQAHFNQLSQGGFDLRNVSVMQANGGLVNIEHALDLPLQSAKSGPSAAVVGARQFAELSKYSELISFDVGGTSTDISIISNGDYRLTSPCAVGGLSFPLSTVDVLSIGAGGGSIAQAGLDHRWRVGPDSAGAVPGPACYGQGGTSATLTDAHLILGRIPNSLLGKSMPLHRHAAERAVGALGETRELELLETSFGILDIVSHEMCGAIRRAAVLRGFNPSDFSLFAIGGAGPLHGAEVAELLGIRRVVIPVYPGLMAAHGMLFANRYREFVAPVSLRFADIDIENVTQEFERLTKRAEQWLNAESIAPPQRSLQRKMDCRYVGMTHTSTISCPNPNLRQSFNSREFEAAIEAFHELFEIETGRSWRDREDIEIVNLRVAATGLNRDRHDDLSFILPDECGGRSASSREVGFLGQRKTINTQILSRAMLTVGTKLEGPLVIEQYEATTVIPPNWRCEVDERCNLILTPVD